MTTSDPTTTRRAALRAWLRAVEVFSSDAPLRGGWAWGPQYLKNWIAVADVPVGRGHVYLFGPEIAFRAQPHATFKFLFNGIHQASRKAPGATSTAGIR